LHFLEHGLLLPYQSWHDLLTHESKKTPIQ
jgi:hypothetical protein